MARSTRIYVVMSKSTESQLAAFTVKHELAAWLDKHGWDNDWLILSLPDGGAGERVRLRCPQDTHNRMKDT
jgi:hypothetical protein